MAPMKTPHFSSDRESGAYPASSIACQAYTLGDDRLGILLVNLRSDLDETVHLPVDPAAYGNLGTDELSLNS